MKRDAQSLFDLEEFSKWKKEWQDMPEFVQENLESLKCIEVCFESIVDIDKFSILIKQKLTPNTRSIWYPEAKITRYSNKRYSDA